MYDQGPLQIAVEELGLFVSQDGLDNIERIVDELALPIEEAYKTADPINLSDRDNLTENLLYSLWSSILSLAQSLPSDRASPLASVITLLSRRPSPLIDDLERLETLKSSYRPWSIDNGRLWFELCMFQWSTSEMFDSSYEQLGTERGRERWLNLNRFLAHLTAEQVSDESFLGLAVLRESLEGESFGGASDNTAKRAVLLSACFWVVRVTDHWLTHAWEEMSPREASRDSLWRGDLFRINEERIEFWRQRCKDLAVEETDQAVKMP